MVHGIVILLSLLVQSRTTAFTMLSYEVDSNLRITLLFMFFTLLSIDTELARMRLSF